MVARSAAASYDGRMRQVPFAPVMVLGIASLALAFGACTSFDSDAPPTGVDAGGETDAAKEAFGPVTGTGVLDDAGRDAESGTSEAGVDSAPPLEMHEFCVAEVNKHRASIGVAPVARWAANETCNDSQALSDFNAGQTHSNFNACTETGQAACRDWPSADPNASLRGCIEGMWAEGPGDFATHSNYETVAKPSFTMVSCVHIPHTRRQAVGGAGFQVTSSTG